MNKTKNHKQIVVVIIALLSGFLILSCFTWYTASDNTLESYIKNNPGKVVFRTYFIDDRPVHYMAMGNDTSPVLMFIHGAPGEWQGYRRQLEDSILQQHFYMISVDRPGYGKSGSGKAVTDIFRQAELLQPVIDSIKKHKAIIVIGRSFGAPVAAKLAANNPGRVNALILLGGAIDPEKEKFWWFSDFGKWQIIRRLLPDAVNVATDEKLSHVNELRKLLPEWKKLNMPVSILHGADDWLVDTSNLYFAKRVIKHAPIRSFIIPETSHLVSDERPELLRKEIFVCLKLAKN